jgi:hypothetical protein
MLIQLLVSELLTSEHLSKNLFLEVDLSPVFNYLSFYWGLLIWGIAGLMSGVLTGILVTFYPNHNRIWLGAIPIMVGCYVILGILDVIFIMLPEIFISGNIADSSLICVFSRLMR